MILIAPISLTTYYPEETAVEELNYDFMYYDIYMLTPYIFLLSVWISYQVVKRKWVKIILSILLVISSAFFTLYGLIGLTLPIQDFHPYIGLYFMLILLPSIILFFILNM